MNSFYEYFAAQQKLAAFRQAKRLQRGVKLGENQPPSMATKFTTAPLQIGTGDFSVEFYGNSYGSDANLGYPFILYADGIALNRKFSTLARQGTNGVALLLFGETTFTPSYVIEDDDALFHMVVTRSGTDVALYINGSKVNDFATDSIVDFDAMDFLVANSRNVGFFRVWNMCLSADDVTAHYNNGDPMGYVVPKAKKDGLLAEYLPQNLMYGRDDKSIATSWLDSAKQMPLSDEYMEPLFQSIGGYDMTANGAPEIIYNE